IVYRLSGTGTEGATLRVYLERFEPIPRGMPSPRRPRWRRSPRPARRLRKSRRWSGVRNQASSSEGKPMLSSARVQERLARRTIALVLAGGRGSRLKQLTDRRAKPAVFFGGKFRIIDFALSN